MKRRLSLLTAAVGLACATGPGWAQSSAQAVPASAEAGPKSPQAGSEQNDVAKLIAAGRYAEAFPIVERQVMLHPNDVSGWINYARVVHALGRHDESRAVLSFIERELSSNLTARQLIDQFDPPDQRLIARHQWRGEISVLTGHESNANAGPAVRGLTLTTPGEAPIVLELAPQSLPQPSGSHLIEARMESSHALGNGVNFSALLDWRQRNTPDAKSAGSRQWQADGMLTFGGSETPTSARQWFVAGSWLDYDYGGSALFERQRLAVGVDQRFGLQSAMPCRVQGSLEHEWRHHPAQDGLISDLRAVQVAGVCAYEQHRWTLMLRLGSDQARRERPGGDQLRQDLIVGYRIDLSRWGQMEVQASYARSRDDTVYNVLFGDERRRLARTQLNLAYASVPIREHWQVIARAELFHQRANIGLFRLRGNSVHVGLRYTF